MLKNSSDESLVQTLRKYIVWSGSLTLVTVLLGSSLNNLGFKYGRTHHGGGGAAGCEREVYTFSEPDSVFCCDGLRRHDWVCIASFDPINKIMTSVPWAYILPLTPWLSNFVFNVDTQPSSHFPRLAFYLTLFGLRFFVLYILLSRMQSFANEVWVDDLHDGCWYQHLRVGGCHRGFDFSDHVVFHYANYIVPVSIESAWSLYSMRLHANALTSMERISPSSVKPWFRYVPALLLSLATWMCSSRSMIFTAMYMHTPAECLMALCILALAVAGPLYAYADPLARRLSGSSSDSYSSRNSSRQR